MREISWSKLNKLPLQNYEGNWTLARHEPVPVGVLRKRRGN